MFEQVKFGRMGSSSLTWEEGSRRKNIVEEGMEQVVSSIADNELAGAVVAGTDTLLCYLGIRVARSAWTGMFVQEVGPGPVVDLGHGMDCTIQIWLFAAVQSQNTVAELVQEMLVVRMIFPPVVVERLQVWAHQKDLLILSRA